MNRRAFLAGVGTGASLALAGCTGALGGSTLADDEYDVGMSASAFEPSVYEVSVGDTVTWGNTSQRSHTVTAVGSQIPEGADYFASGGFDSQQAAEEGWQGQNGAIAVGETYSHTFEVAGEYQYLCIPHRAQGMIGKVIVTD
ncbi:MAG: plastocyanin/azurin family copper-binding protein [Halobacteriaceae archaeon]